MTPALRSLAVGLVIALLSSSCSDEPRPRFEDPLQTPSPSDSTSSTAAEKEPWEVKSQMGAEKFSQHWLSTFNQALVSGDTSALTKISSDKCRTCRRIADQIDEVTSGDGFFRGKGWRALDADANPLKQNQTEVAMNVLRSRQKVRESVTAPVKSFPATRGIYRADLAWVNDAWRMRELVNLS